MRSSRSIRTITRSCLEHGRPLYFRLNASEKVYADYQLMVTNRGGHSSEPVPGQRHLQP